MKLRVTDKFWILIVLTVLAGCVRPQEKLQKDIEAAEKEMSMSADAQPSFDRADSLIKLYLNYSDQYKDDTLSPVYMFKAGDLCMKTGRYQQAIDLFGYIQRYKGFRHLGDALFLRGFIYDSQLGDTASARKCYQEFLAAYPGHEFADDAHHLIENLDLSPDQLIQKLQNGQVADSTLSSK
ncbi:MAG: tetratricopeptide repeat protein [Bacteroidia bacterium]